MVRYPVYRRVVARVARSECPNSSVHRCFTSGDFSLPDNLDDRTVSRTLPGSIWCEWSYWWVWGEAAVRDPQAEPSDLIRSVSRALRVLEAVGQSPRGLTVKQIARRCDFTVATTYHLVRTLAYEGYVIRREDGTYIVGLEIADRYRELVTAFRGPATVGEALRRAAVDTGYSQYLGRFVGSQVAVTAVAEGHRSPYLEDLVPGFDEGAHATAMGKA